MFCCSEVDVDEDEEGIIMLMFSTNWVLYGLRVMWARGCLAVPPVLRVCCTFAPVRTYWDWVCNGKDKDILSSSFFARLLYQEGSQIYPDKRLLTSLSPSSIYPIHEHFLLLYFPLLPNFKSHHRIAWWYICLVVLTFYPKQRIKNFHDPFFLSREKPPNIISHFTITFFPRIQSYPQWIVE